MVSARSGPAQGDRAGWLIRHVSNGVIATSSSHQKLGDRRSASSLLTVRTHLTTHGTAHIPCRSNKVS